jgi:hypothetical protein
MNESKKEKPLPKPPKTPFGRQRPDESAQDQGSLIADRMAVAAAEGKLDEFLKNEMPDNEYARSLATMMMGMTGVMPMSGAATGMPEAPDAQQPQPSETASPEQATAAIDVPEDVRMAIQSEDVQGLMAMLRREHQKRSSSEEPLPQEVPPSPSIASPSPSASIPMIDKDLIDALIQIAQDNNITLDWMILRAIKVYVQDYQKTGKL